MIFPDKYPLCAVGGVLWLCCQMCLAGNWPNLRGPSYDGSNSETGLPVTISKTDHVAWKIDLPGIGSSTPVVWEKFIFVTAVNKEKDGVVGIKIDIHSGKIEWTREIDKARRNDRRTDMATPSPTTDGKYIIFPSGSGKIAAYDFSGELVWKKDLKEEYGEFALKWTWSSSPVLFEDSLYLQVLQRNEEISGIPGRASFILALDPKTGAEKWLHTRSSSAVGESREAYSSPIPVTHDGRKEILVAGADCLTGHLAESGKEIWRWETWNRERKQDWRIIPSPVYGDDMIIACAPKGQPVYTFFAGSTGQVNLGDLKWKSKMSALSCDVTTPSYYDGYFYILNGRDKMLSCVEPYSGRIEWSQSIPARAKIEASPSSADGKVYVLSHTGEVFIYKAGAKFELLHNTVLGRNPDAKNRSAIVPAQGRLIIRLGKELWCMD